MTPRGLVQQLVRACVSLCVQTPAAAAWHTQLTHLQPTPTTGQAMPAANSRGDSAGCGRGFIQAMTATMAVSCVLVLVLVSAPEFLLGLFQTGPEVMALAKTYLKIRCACALRRGAPAA